MTQMSLWQPMYTWMRTWSLLIILMLTLSGVSSCWRYDTTTSWHVSHSLTVESFSEGTTMCGTTAGCLVQTYLQATEAGKLSMQHPRRRARAPSAVALLLSPLSAMVRSSSNMTLRLCSPRFVELIFNSRHYCVLLIRGKNCKGPEVKAFSTFCNSKAESSSPPLLPK